jgi:4-carboxymuconolactone decarboxylase
MYRFAALFAGVLMSTAPTHAADEYRPNRLTPLNENALTPEQQGSAAKIAEMFGTPKIPAGPFNVFARKQSFTEGAIRMFKATRQAKLDPRLFEMAVLIVGRQWDADFEWYAHHKQAAKLGIAPEVIEAIRLGKTPIYAKSDEQAVYDVVHELSDRRKLSQPTYDRAVAVLGEEQMVELVAAAGFYTMVAMTVVAFDVQIPPPNERHPLPPIKR